MNYIEASFQVDKVTTRTVKYNLDEISYYQFKKKLQEDFFSYTQIVYIDEEKEQVKLEDEKEFYYVKFDMEKKNNVVTMFIRDGKKVEQPSKQAILISNEHEYMMKINKNTSFKQMKEYFQTKLKKTHILFNFKQDGEFFSLDENDWKLLATSQQKKIYLNFQFEKIPDEKIILLTCLPNREQKFQLNKNTNLSEIQKVVYEQFNKEKFSLQYESEVDGEKHKVSTEDEWKKFKDQAYDEDKLFILNEKPEENKEVKEIKMLFLPQNNMSSYKVHKIQPFESFKTGFIDIKGKKGKSQIFYELKNEEKQRKIEDQKEWENFKKDLFEGTVQIMKIRTKRQESDSICEMCEQKMKQVHCYHCEKCSEFKIKEKESKIIEEKKVKQEKKNLNIEEGTFLKYLKEYIQKNNEKKNTELLMRITEVFSSK